MSDLLVMLLVVVGVIAVWFVAERSVRLKPQPLAYDPIHALEHDCWPDQTVEWFGHKDCRSCGSLPGITRAEINAAGYEAIAVPELGDTEIGYVKGRRLAQPGHGGQVEPRHAVQPAATPRAEWFALGEPKPLQPCWIPTCWCRGRPESGGRPGWLPEPDLPDPGRNERH